MARTVSLADLRSRSLIRAGLPTNTLKIDTSTGGWLDDEINNSATALYDKILLAWGEDYFGTRSTLLTVAGVDTVNAPTDFYRLLGLDWLSGSEYITLGPIDWSRRNDYQATTWGLSLRPRYLLSANRIILAPTPSSVETLRIHYVPTITTVDSTHPLEGVHGWDEFVVLDVAIKCREACRMDPGTMMVDRDRCEARIVAMAPRRDMREVPKLSRRRVRTWAWRYQ